MSLLSELKIGHLDLSDDRWDRYLSVDELVAYLKTVRSHLCEDIDNILQAHANAGYRKTGTGDYPLNSLYKDLTHSRHSVFPQNRKWKFRAPDRYGARPINGLMDLLELNGYDCYSDGRVYRVKK